MITIINVDATHFSINGLLLGKVYLARAVSNDKIQLETLETKRPLQDSELFSQFEIDSVTYGTQLETINALNQVVFSGVGGAVTISDSFGNPTSPINPVQTGLDILYENDIDWQASDFTGWTGDPRELFGNVNNGGIYNDSVDNPKVFILRLIRSRQGRAFGIGTSTGNYSNVKATILGSSDAERGVLDLSEDPSKRTSTVYSQEEFAYNAIKVEFFTADRVDVTNVFIAYNQSNRKQDYTLKFGVNPDVDSGGSETVWTLGGQYIFTTTPQLYYISSSNAGDTQIVEGELVVINTEGRKQLFTYQVTLQGQTKVLIPTGGLLVSASNRAYSDNGVSFLGDIYIYEDTAIVAGVPSDLSKVRSHILQGREQTEQAVYTIPEFIENGQQVAFAELYKWSAAIIRNRTTSGLFDLFVVDPDKTPKVKSSLPASENFVGEKDYGENTPMVIYPGADVYVQISEVTVNDAAATADFIIRLVAL
jgi:hypothetical protein